MDYTLSPDYATHVGTGNRMHEENAAVTTVVSEKDMNSLIWSAMEVVKAGGLAGVQFDEAVPGSYQVLVKAIKRLTGANVTTVNAGNSPFALTADHAGVVIMDASAGNASATLPLANVLLAMPFRFVRPDAAAANTATVNRAGGDTIDGAASFTLGPGYDFRTIAASGGALWLTLAAKPVLSSWRNKIINGDFSVNERGYVSGAVLGAGAYAFDKWKAGAAGCTLTFSTVNNVTTVTITAGSLQSIIEGGMLKSGTHVMSWVGTAQGKIEGGAYSASGVTGAAVGGINLTVEFNAGTLSFVQLEPGTLPSTFEQRPPGIELLLCQRYGHRVKVAALQTNGWAGSPSAGIGNAVYFYPVQLRASPTIPTIAWTLSQASVTGVSVANTSCLIFNVQGTVGSGGATASNSADFFVGADF